jgi:excisionase family DNA binding protein
MPKATATRKSYLAPSEVAEILMVSPASVRMWASKGDLVSMLTPGGHRRFDPEAVQRFARERNLKRRRRTGSELRVLVVDDDSRVAAYLVRLLEMRLPSSTTMLAHDGYSTGRLMQVFRPDVVLLDLMMPGLDGFDVCAQIKSDPNYGSTRVIAMTGFATAENVARILRVGAEACIVKPFNESELLMLLGNHLTKQSVNAAG